MQPTPAFPTLGTTVWVFVGLNHDDTPKYLPGIILSDYIGHFDHARWIVASLEIAPDRFGHVTRQNVTVSPDRIFALV